MNESSEERRRILLAALGGLATQFALLDASAQDAAKVMPRAYRVVFENDRVRVLEFTARPGMGICGESMHSHPAHLTVVLSEWHGKVTLPDGSVRNIDHKVGDVFWAEAQTHKVENVGTNNTRILIIELKNPPGVKA